MYAVPIFCVVGFFFLLSTVCIYIYTYYCYNRTPSRYYIHYIIGVRRARCASYRILRQVRRGNETDDERNWETEVEKVYIVLWCSFFFFFFHFVSAPRRSSIAAIDQWSSSAQLYLVSRAFCVYQRINNILHCGTEYTIIRIYRTWRQGDIADRNDCVLTIIQWDMYTNYK